MKAKKSRSRAKSVPAKKPARARRPVVPSAPVHAREVGEVSRLGIAQQRLLTARWKRSASLVDDRDVEYVIDRGVEDAEDLAAVRVPWISRLGRQALLLHQLLTDWWNEEADARWSTIAGAAAALLYYINPIDLIPDMIPVIGHADDALVVALAVARGRADLRRYARLRGLDLRAHGL